MNNFPSGAIEHISIHLESHALSVAPGGWLTIPIVLENNGEAEVVFQLRFEGIPETWASLPRSVMELVPGEQKQVTITLHPPPPPEGKIGRYPFRIQVASQAAPGQAAQVECTLALAAISSFHCELRPARIQAGHSARLLVENRGNIQETYQCTWQSEDDALVFQPQQAVSLRVSPGETGVAEFQVEPHSRPVLGGEVVLPFKVFVRSIAKQVQALDGQVTTRAWIPVWIVPIILVLCLTVMCASTYLFTRQRSNVSQATRTASANQTAAAAIGEQDTDGDGLTNREELAMGTDPDNPDTDGDQLWDGDEVKQRQTDPLNPDTDADVLNDGDEVQRGTDPLRPDTDTDTLMDGEEVQRGTDPLVADTDADELIDGEEVQRATDPLKPDTDGDKLSDGQEVQMGTDPLNPDTDSDRLIDGEESPPCPEPRNPDTDGDGIIDGLDPDPCDPVNPSLTASALPLTDTPAPPTLTPTEEPTVPSIDLGPGAIVFESNLDGNSEIYVINTQTYALYRLTNDPAVDTQPAWSPDGRWIAFASNRSGNFEIYVMNANGLELANKTNNEQGDDLYPSWSPDGNWLAFSTNRDGNQEVYAIEIAGPGIHNLSNNPAAQDYQPDWFRGGGVLVGSELILFISNRDGNPEIYRMRTDGSEQTRLTEHPAADTYPKGSPQGNRVVFTSERVGPSEVYVMDMDGGNLTRLTYNPTADILPIWSPSGEWIAFTTNRDGQEEIYVMRSDGSQLFNLTNNPGQDFFPNWR